MQGRWLRCLDVIDRIEHDHAFGYLGRIVSEFTACRAARQI
jgi:hypothetical protein